MIMPSAFSKTRSAPVRALVLAAALGAVGCACDLAWAADPPALAGSMGLVQAAGDLHISTKTEDGKITILIDLPESAKVDWTTDGREVVLHFPHEVNAPTLVDLADNTDGWLENATQGYDTILLRASRDVTHDITIKDRQIRIVMTATGQEEITAPETDKRLALLEVELKSRNQGPLAARPDAEKLAAANPKDVQPTLLFADIEQRLGNWQSALEQYDRALTLSPDQPDVIQAQAQTRHDRGPQYRVDFAKQTISTADTQYITRQQGWFEPTSRTVAGFDYEIREVWSPSVQKLDGNIGPFQGWRQRAELYVGQNIDEEGLFLRGGILAGAGTAGPSVRVEKREDSERLTFIGEYHRAYWEYVEGMANDGRRDRLEAQYSRALDQDERLVGSLFMAINRYGVKGISEVTNSAAPILDLTYALMPSRPLVNLTYNIDAEYLFGTKNFFNSEGQEYSPLPITSREIHSAIATVSGYVTDYMRYTVSGGYQFDRLDLLSKGPRFTGELSYESTPDFEFGANYIYSKATSRGSGDLVNRYGLYLLVRF